MENSLSLIVEFILFYFMGVVYERNSSSPSISRVEELAECTKRRSIKIRLRVGARVAPRSGETH